MDQTPPPASASAPRPVLVYDGRISELFGIFLLNLLLTILTFGIFRFWAITRIRRYLWSHMRFEGTRFTYTGKGKEIFLGFLLAIAIMFLIFAGAGLIAAVLAKAQPVLAAVPLGFAYLGLFILFGGARYSAQRYRLSRTEWRGIRGGMTGSALRYGLAWMLYLLLCVVTLYQAVPWMQVGLARRRIDASRFGSAVFRFAGTARRLYLCWLATIGGYLLLVGLIVGAVVAIEGSDLGHVFSGTAGPAREAAIRRALPAVVVGVVAFGIASGLLATWYYTRLIRLLTGYTTASLDGAETVRFSSTVSPGALLWLLVSNLLIVIFTLGFGVPVVLHRTAGYIARTTLMTGAFDAHALVQTSLGRPRFGEGFLQALDPGIV